MTAFDTTALRGDGNTLWALDQRALPAEEKWINITNPEDAVGAIQTLAVRGAPLIGVAAALCLGKYSQTHDEMQVLEVAKKLRAARPTAVNLAWAIDRLISTLHNKKDVCREAELILNEDIEMCDKIAAFGVDLIPGDSSVITHCNTGALATAGVGTAVGVLVKAHQLGRNIHVFVDETRPLLQGARLTAWELKRRGVPYTLICDNMSASAMREKKIRMVIVGADRIAVNGDFANKIGTYGVAILSRFHQIPLIVAAPSSTIDLGIANGSEIPIEERPQKEVRENQPCWNPAFDVTPGELVSAFVLETGVYSLSEFTRTMRLRSEPLS